MRAKNDGLAGRSLPSRRRVHPLRVRELAIARGTAKTNATKVMIVEGDGLTRNGLKSIIALHPELRLVDETPDLNTAIARVPSVRPQVVFVEAWLASENDGAPIRAILRAHPPARIVAFGTGRREEEIFRLLNAGVSGYLVRQAIDSDLLKAVHWAQTGRRYIPPEVQRLVDERERRPHLTPRERGVLDLLAQARSNATIAVVLGISVGTVKLHVRAILAKLGVEDRAEAALVAMERGFSSLR